MTAYSQGHRRRSSRGEMGAVRLYLLLAAALSGLYSLLLTVIPSRAVTHGASATGVGVLLAVLAIAGLLADGVVGKVVAWGGTRTSLSAGVLALTVGAALLLSAPHTALLLTATAVSGLGLGLLTAPILGGLASAAADRQIVAQSLNAGWQRIGALVAALFLIEVLVSPDDRLVASALVLLLAILGVGTATLEGEGRASHRTRKSPRRRPNQLLRSVRASPLLQAGVSINVATAIMLIVGSSFYPVVLHHMEAPELLVPGLVCREVLAIAAVWAASSITTRSRLDRAWMLSAVIGMLGLVVMPFTSMQVAVVVLFSMHGPAMSLAILLGNVRAFDGTTHADRLAGYAACAMAMRLSSVGVPVALGVAVDVSVPVAMATAAIGVLAVVVLYARLTAGR